MGRHLTARVCSGMRDRTNHHRKQPRHARSSGFTYGRAYAAERTAIHTRDAIRNPVVFVCRDIRNRANRPIPRPPGRHPTNRACRDILGETFRRAEATDCCPLWDCRGEAGFLHDAPGTAAGVGRRCPSLCDDRLSQQPVQLPKRLVQAIPSASMRRSAHTTAIRVRTISRPSLSGARRCEHRLTRYAFRWQEPAVSTGLTPAM